MQKSSCRARTEAARVHSTIRRAPKPEEVAKPSDEPWRINAHEGKGLGGFCRRLSHHQVRPIQMRPVPWSLKVNPLAQPPSLA